MATATALNKNGIPVNAYTPLKVHHPMPNKSLLKVYRGNRITPKQEDYTNHEQRKHYKQMTIPEQMYCETRLLLSAEYFTIGKHAQDRYRERGITLGVEELRAHLQTGRVNSYTRASMAPSTLYVGEESIPVKVPRHTTERLQVQSTWDTWRYLNIVIDITNNKIITLYLSSKGNNGEQYSHTYNPNLKVY